MMQNRDFKVGQRPQSPQIAQRVSSEQALPMQTLVGNDLVTRVGSKIPTSTAIAGCKYVAVYCSAHWCPPCRQFTPLLGEFFKTQAAALKVAVVFASGDRDEKSFKDYFASHAWDLAIPFGDSHRDSFMQTHSISSIPSLLLFSSNGHLITNEGVQLLQAAMHGGAPPFPFVWGADLIGANIRLTNIGSRPELNGAAGLVVGVVAASKRFRVMLHDKQEMSVSRSKLLRRGEGGWGDEYLGKTVAVHGLVKAAHLNGTQGFAVGADTSSQRIIVVFSGEGDEEGKEMALKPENLKL